jgi:Na+/H+ antiporter NhaD/arsenite permease-like protein
MHLHAPLPFAAGSLHPESPLWLSFPFVLLLLMIAVLPLCGDRVRHWWERYQAAVCIGLGLAVALIFIVHYDDWHTPAHTVHEYFSFIVLIGALFTVSGGIHIRIRGESAPFANVVFLGVAAVLANLIGTTGASMVLIRPWIRMNKYRVTAHHIVFFIFIVSNVGGALTPIGDPPLFLGFLHGLPFFWITQQAFLPWLFVVSLLLAIFYVVDRINFLRAPKLIRTLETMGGPLVRVEGKRSFGILLLVVAAVFLPGTWFIREVVMISLAVLSMLIGKKEVRDLNGFNFGPVREVAILFAGIFLTMMPALEYVRSKGGEAGLDSPRGYYFVSGTLSSMLDNAPTYLTFLQLAEVTVTPESVQRSAMLKATPLQREKVVLDWMRWKHSQSESGHPAALYILAVSLGAVFFGAMTYIGNGPNFMVRSIAEAEGVRTPSFFGYILKFSLPFLLPVLMIAAFVFL